MLTNTINRIRRNHALEHATIHVLSEKYKNFSAQGNSTHAGFYLNIYGNLPDGAVADAVQEAYTRLKRGEHHLGVHPNCGTVLLTTATLATLAAQATFSLEQRRQKRSSMDLTTLCNTLPSAILAVVVALIVSRPLGIALQARYTVDSHLADLQVVQVRQISPSPVTRLFQLLLGQGRSKASAYQVHTH